MGDHEEKSLKYNFTKLTSLHNVEERDNGRGPRTLHKSLHRKWISARPPPPWASTCGLL
jgi:hypothetical protein